MCISVAKPVFVAAVFALCSLISCSRTETVEQKNVTVRLKWIHQAQFAGFYVAKRKSFYHDAGLNVTLNPGGIDFPAIQMVVGGDEQFGVTGADQILLAREKHVPVVAVAVIYKKSPFVLFSLKSKNITRPRDLIGKRVGVKLGGNEELTYRALLNKVGISSSRIIEIPVKYDMSPLFAGVVDVWPGYTINEPIVAEEQGHPVNSISPSDYGVNLYADTVFTTESMIKNQPDLVSAFVQATIKGWQYAIDHPTEAVDATLSFSDRLVRQHETRMMQASIPLVKPDASAVGYMDPSVWEGMYVILQRTGFVKDRVDVGKAFTDRFLTEK